MSKLETISKEKMESVKELSEIQTNIGKGKAVLSELKRDTALYLKEREEQALEIINDVLSSSKESLESIAKYRTELKDYKNQVVGFYESIKETGEELVALKTKFDEARKSFHIEVEEKRKEISKQLKDIKEERKQLKEQKKSLNKQQIEIDREKIQLRDQRETLERAFNLKK